MEKNKKTEVELLKQMEVRLSNIETQLPLSKDVLNIEEVSQLTGISKSTLYKLTCTRGIPHFKQSKHLYFDRDEVFEWLKSNRIKTQEEIEAEALSLTIRKGGLK